MTDKIHQDFSDAKAGHNIVAGDLNQTFDYGDFDVNVEAIKELVAKLEIEEADDIRSMWIEDLQFFEENHPEDGIEGLDAKLDAAGLGSKKLIARRQKEQFSKFLERRALYSSAQQLLALCLHKIYTEFDVYIHPKCGKVSHDDLFEIIYEQIVKPLVKGFSHGSFILNHGLVMGMTYWLADRCYVRWHEVH